MAMCTYSDFLRMATAKPHLFALKVGRWTPVHERENNGMFTHTDASRVPSHWFPQAVVCLSCTSDNNSPSSHLVVSRWVKEMGMDACYDPQANSVWYFRRNVDAMHCELTFGSQFPFILGS